MTRLILAILLSLLLPVQSWAAVAGAAGSAMGSGTNSIAAQAYPATTNAGDLLVLLVCTKPGGGETPVPAAGENWLTLANNNLTSDDGVAPGTNDSGKLQAYLFYKVSVGTEAGTTFLITITSGTSAAGYVARFTNATGAWLVAAANGQFTVHSTSWSITTGSDPGLANNDMVGAFSCRTEGSSATASSEAMSQTSATFGAATERLDNGTSFGDNIGPVMSDHAVTTAGTGNITYTFTNGLSTSGATILLRVREDTATTIQSTSGFLGTIMK